MDYRPLRRRSAPVILLTAVALGLRDVFEDPDDRPAIVRPAPGGPPGDEPFRLLWDPDDPAGTIAVLRPTTWPN